MTETVWSDIGPALYQDIAPLFTLGGPTWTRTRPSGDGVTAAVTTASTPDIGPLYLVPIGIVRQGVTLPQVFVSESGYLWIGDPSVDIRAGDELTDGTVTATVPTAPDTRLGALLAPAEMKAGT